MKISAEADNSKLDDLMEFLDKWPRASLQLAEDTFRELQPTHLADFQSQPPVRKWPGDYPGNRLPFDTENQRRWYWANIGKPYTRKGKMAKNLKEDVIRTEGKVSVKASYPSASTKYVLGNILGEKIESFQQRFHKATGWQLAAPKLERHAQNYIDTFTRRYESFIAFYGQKS